MTQLIRYDAARHAVVSARNVDEAKAIADKATALKAYARQARDPELMSWVAEIQLRARRRIGQLCAEMERASNQHGLSKAGKSKSATLKAAGLSNTEAHRCERLSAVPEEKFEAVIAARRFENKAVTADDLERYVAKQSKRAAPLAQAALDNCCTVSDLSRVPVKCGTIYADPPWVYGNQATRASTGDHYVGLSVDEMCELPVAPLAADDAHLHLWTTNAFLFDAKRVMEAWGFEYKSCFIWVKPQMGMGNYWRVSHEFLLLGVRGSAAFADHSLMSWGRFERRRHSAKPEEIRQLIERASPGPRLEMFARRKARGWYVWGNEIERTVFDAALEAA